MVTNFILTPFFLDQPLPGLETLVEDNWLVNKPQLPEGTTQQRMGVLYQPLAEFISNSAGIGDLPVSIAGDCCTSLGILSGLQGAGHNPNLIWLDAHGDFNTWETTPSGFLGGMPLAMLVGRGEQTIMELLGAKPLAEQNVILFDGRDLDPGEREALASSGIHHVKNTVDLIEFNLPPGPIWVHFDTDLTDAGEAPAMNYPVTGGPGVEELERVFSSWGASGQIAAVSMSTWNPELDMDGRSREVSLKLLASLIRPSI
jgi:arginase